PSFHNHHGTRATSVDEEAPGENGGEVMDDDQLQWAVVERLPTFRRVRLALMFEDDDHKKGNSTVVDQEAAAARKRLWNATSSSKDLFTKIEEDNLRLLTKYKERIDRVGVDLPTLEKLNVNWSMEHPSLLFGILSKIQFRGVTSAPGCKSQATKLEILKNISGIIKPSWMTLLLGPPGCGKTTLLKALSGKLDQSLKVTGEITYNGYKFNEFIPQKTSAYISQYDQHISEMTVRETLDFSARCQGTGDRADIMEEICRKEKQAGIIPEPDIDTYIKVVSEKDQEQYWQHHEVPYTFVSVDKFVNLFHKFHVGQKLTEEPSIPPTKAETDKKALSFDVYPSRWELFKACMDREWLLMKRNSFVHVSKSSQ
ncbi:hypothetical protein Tsubulata_049959, partial [Turnera subulata]